MDPNNESGAHGEAGGDSGGSKQWLSSIPENLRDNEAFTSAESLGDIYQGYADMHARSKDMLAIPGEDATDEDRAAFYAKLGRPEAPDQYEFAKPELPEGVPYDEAADAAFKQLAFEKGLSQQAAAEMHQWYWDTVKAGHEQEAQQTQQALESLKGEWKGDTFKTNSETALRAFSKFGGDEAKKMVEEARYGGVKLGDHPVFLRTFAKIGKAISDDNMADDRSSNLDAIASDEEKAKQRFPNTKF